MLSVQDKITNGLYKSVYDKIYNSTIKRIVGQTQANIYNPLAFICEPVHDRIYEELYTNEWIKTTKTNR